MAEKVTLKDYEDLLRKQNRSGIGYTSGAPMPTGVQVKKAEAAVQAKPSAAPTQDVGMVQAGGGGVSLAGKAGLPSLPASGASAPQETAGAAQGGEGSLYAYLRQIAEASRDVAYKDAAGRYDALVRANAAAMDDARAYASDERERLDAEKTQALRDASIMYDRMAKYLPQLQAAQGISGSGLANEMAVGVYNDILNRQAGAQASYNEGVRESERSLDEYRRQLGLQEAQAEADRASAQYAADAAYNDQLAQYRIAEEQDRKTDAQDLTAYSGVETALNAQWQRLAGSDGLMSVDDYQKWAQQVEAMRGQLPAEQQALVDNYVAAQRAYVRSDEEQQVFTNTTRPAAAYNGGLNNTKLGNDFTIMAGEEKVKVELGPSVTLADNYSRAYGDGDVFEHNGKIYINYAGGTYEVRARNDSARRQYDLQTLKNYLREQATQ